MCVSTLCANLLLARRLPDSLSPRRGDYANPRRFIFLRGQNRGRTEVPGTSVRRTSAARHRVRQRPARAQGPLRRCCLESESRPRPDGRARTRPRHSVPRRYRRRPVAVARPADRRPGRPRRRGTAPLRAPLRVPGTSVTGFGAAAAPGAGHFGHLVPGTSVTGFGAAVSAPPGIGSFARPEATSTRPQRQGVRPSHGHGWRGPCCRSSPPGHGRRGQDWRSPPQRSRRP